MVSVSILQEELGFWIGLALNQVSADPARHLTANAGPGPGGNPAYSEALTLAGNLRLL